MRLPASVVWSALAVLPAGGFDLSEEPHHYFTAPLRDRFSEFRARWEKGEVSLDTSGERAFLLSLLRALDIPASSQMLVYSTTSLQLSLISPRNPRAIYFNEEVAVGYIPGGKIEISSWDPDLGVVFFIFPVPRTGERPDILRADRCMNCHANEDTRHVPGLVLKSVIPGRTGGSLDAMRRHDTGHQIPLEERFGGWHVTGAVPPGTWANAVGNAAPGKPERVDQPPGRDFRWDRYATDTSDILPHLLLEHQAGFINRLVELVWEARQTLHDSGGRPDEARKAKFNRMVDDFVSYVFFRDEALLPDGGLTADTACEEDFLRDRHQLATGESLRDLDLKSRLFRYRCSFMVQAAPFQKIPDAVRLRILARMKQALVTADDPLSGHLGEGEKRVILALLEETLPGWPR